MSWCKEQSSGWTQELLSKGSLPTLLLRVISTNLTRRQTSSNKHVHGVPPTSWLSTTITPPSSSSSLAVLTYANKWRLNCCFHRSPALSILLCQTWDNITAQYESFLGFFRQQSVMLSWCSHLDPEEWKKYSCLFDYSDERLSCFYWWLAVCRNVDISLLWEIVE